MKRKHWNGQKPLWGTLALKRGVGRVYPSEAVVMLNDRQNKAMADQLTTVSKLRLISRAGRLTNADMQKVEHAVKVQLGLLETALQT